MTAAENIHIIGKEAGQEETQAAQGETTTQPPLEPTPVEAVDKTSRDMGRVALFIAILAVILLVVFFFGMNQNISGLTARVDGLSTLKDDVAVLGGRVDTVEASMEKLPVKARKMVVGTMLSDMAQRAGYLGTQVDSQEQSVKLSRAMELLQQVQVEVQQEAAMLEAAPAPEAAAAPAVEAVTTPEAASAVEAPAVEAPAVEAAPEVEVPVAPAQ